MKITIAPADEIALLLSIGADRKVEQLDITPIIGSVAKSLDREFPFQVTLHDLPNGAIAARISIDSLELASALTLDVTKLIGEVSRWVGADRSSLDFTVRLKG